MPASLVAITDAQRTPAREHKLEMRLQAARSALVAEMDLYEDPQQLKTPFEAYEFACSKYQRYWEHRLLKAERDLRATLGADLTSEQRTLVLTTLYGEKEGRRRDVTVLSEQERQLVDHYRGMDATGRQMLRTLCARLATSTQDTQSQAPGVEKNEAIDG